MRRKGGEQADALVPTPIVDVIGQLKYVVDFQRAVVKTDGEHNGFVAPHRPLNGRALRKETGGSVYNANLELVRERGFKSAAELAP